MRFHDLTGDIITTMNSDAATSYNEAVRCLLTDRPGVEEHLQKAISHDSGFALARILLARLRAVRKDSNAVRQHLSAARLFNLTERERSHFDSLCELSAGDAGSACDKMDGHLKRFPNDLLILAIASYTLFFRGGENKKARIEAWYKAAEPMLSKLPLFKGRYAFHLQEIGRLKEAEAHAVAALTDDKGNLYAFHALAHVAAAAGDFEILNRYIKGFDLTPYSETFLGGHLRLHVALGSFFGGEFEKAVQIYFQGRRPAGAWVPPHLEIADFVGLQWRMKIAGRPFHPPAEIQRSVMELAREESRTSRMLFSLVHCALLFAANGESRALSMVASRMREWPIGDRIGEALIQIEKGHLKQGATLLSRISAGELEVIGGSNLERQIFLELGEWAAKARVA